MTTNTKPTIVDACRTLSGRLFYVMDGETFPWLNRYRYAWALDINEVKWDADNGDFMELDPGRIVWQDESQPLFYRLSLDYNGNIQRGQDVPHMFRLKLDNNRIFTESDTRGRHRSTHVQLRDTLITPWTSRSNSRHTLTIWLRRSAYQSGRGATLEFHPDDNNPQK